VSVLRRLSALPYVVSDGLHCFEVAARAGAVHEREVTGVGKASVLNEKFKAVSTRLGNVNDLRAILGELLAALIRAPRRPECGIRVAGVHR
jgi:hypothetical protein